MSALVRGATTHKEHKLSGWHTLEGYKEGTALPSGASQSALRVLSCVVLPVRSTSLCAANDIEFSPEAERLRSWPRCKGLCALLVWPLELVSALVVLVSVFGATNTGTSLRLFFSQSSSSLLPCRDGASSTLSGVPCCVWDVVPVAGWNWWPKEAAASSKKSGNALVRDAALRSESDGHGGSGAGVCATPSVLTSTEAPSCCAASCLKSF